MPRASPPNEKNAPAEKNRGGRPRVGATKIMIALRPADLAALDAWIAAQPDAPSRQDAIRRMITAAKNT